MRNASLIFGPIQPEALFTLSGSVSGPFRFFPAPTVPFTETFSGAGRVFVNLIASPNRAGWEWMDTRYTVSTPEPSAVFLLGLGLVGLGAMGWRYGRS